MALLWWDSYDYIDTAHLPNVYDTVMEGSTVVSGGRCGTNCLRIQSAPAFKGVVKGVAATTTTAIISAAVKRISGSSSGRVWLITSASTPIFDIFINNDGSILGRTNVDAAFPPVCFSTPGGLMPSNEFHYLEIKILFHASAGRVQIRVDGSLTDDYDSGPVLATVTSGDSPNWTGVEFNAPTTGSGGLIYYDDVVIMDTSGSTCNDFLGDVRVEALEPTAAGAHQEWTLGAGSSHWSAVDDGDDPDDDTTYIESETSGQIDTNIHEDSALPTTGVVHAVGMKLLAKKDQPGDRTIAPVTRQGGTDYVGSNESVTQDVYFYEYQAWETNPATSAAWTITEVNNAEYGVKVTN